MRILILSIALAIPATAFALDCSDPQNTIENDVCAHREQVKTDEQLTVVYQRVLTSLDAMDKDPANHIKANLKNGLIAAQRLWVKFREADCQNVYDYWSDGTIRGVMYSGCMKAHAEQRIKELEEYEKTY